jgi:CheY-like chemotaxis protein
MPETTYQKPSTIRNIFETDSGPDRLRGANILYVDDEYVNYMYFSELLSDTGINFHHVFSTKQTLKYISSERKISIVIISSTIAQKTSFKIIRHIKQEFPSLPVITIIENRDLKLEQACIDAGSDFYFSQRIDKYFLIETLSEFLIME